MDQGLLDHDLKDLHRHIRNAYVACSQAMHDEKHLSVTKVLLDEAETIAGYYTLATGQVDFCDLPAEVARRLW